MHSVAPTSGVVARATAQSQHTPAPDTEETRRAAAEAAQQRRRDVERARMAARRRKGQSFADFKLQCFADYTLRNACSIPGTDTTMGHNDRAVTMAGLGPGPALARP